MLEESPSGGAYVQSVVATGLNAPGAIAVDGGGSLYVATRSGVIRLRPLAGSTVQSTVATLSLPLGVGLAVNAQGVVFVADPGAKAILEATPSGGGYTTTLLATGVFGDGVGGALDAAGNLYVFDSSSNEISSLSATSGYTGATVIVACGVEMAGVGGLQDVQELTGTRPTIAMTCWWGVLRVSRQGVASARPSRNACGAWKTCTDVLEWRNWQTQQTQNGYFDVPRRSAFVRIIAQIASVYKGFLQRYSAHGRARKRSIIRSQPAPEPAPKIKPPSTGADEPHEHADVFGGA